MVREVKDVEVKRESCRYAGFLAPFQPFGTISICAFHLNVSRLSMEIRPGAAQLKVDSLPKHLAGLDSKCSKTSLNRPTMRPTLTGPFREVVGLEC